MNAQLPPDDATRKASLINRIVAFALEQRMLILVDIDKLMSSAEMGLIEKLAA